MFVYSLISRVMGIRSNAQRDSHFVLLINKYISKCRANCWFKIGITKGVCLMKKCFVNAFLCLVKKENISITCCFLNKLVFY